MTNTTVVTTLVSGKLTVCTYGGFAPVCYKNAAGQLIGLDISFLTRFAESLGLDIVIIEKPFFTDVWPAPGADECDVAGAGVMKRSKTERPIGKGSWSHKYFQVQRSLLVRAAEADQFDVHTTKKIVVTKGSTAHIDAQKSYPQCKLLFVDDVAEGKADAQEYIVKTLILNHDVDAFGEGDVSNQYLCDKYGADGSLALTGVHPMDPKKEETFNFITRNASSGVHERLNAFIAKNKKCYASKS